MLCRRQTLDWWVSIGRKQEFETKSQRSVFLAQRTASDILLQHNEPSHVCFHLGRAITGRLRRTLIETGGLLFIGSPIIQIGTQATLNTAVSWVPGRYEYIDRPERRSRFPVSGPVALALFAALLVLSAAFFVVIARAMVPPLEEFSAVSADATRRLGRTTLSMLIGGVVVSISVFVGTVFPRLRTVFADIVPVYDEHDKTSVHRSSVSTVSNGPSNQRKVRQNS